MRNRLLFLALATCALACGPSRRDTDDDTEPTTPDAGEKECVPVCGAARCGIDPVCAKSCGTCADGLSCEEGVCVGTPTECLVDAPCVSTSDCPSGFRCNTGMSPPQCHKLYCAPSGGACDDEYFCEEGLYCLSGHCEAPGTTQVTGTVFGRAVTFVDATFVDYQGFGPTLIFSTEPDLCARLEQGRLRADSSWLEFVDAQVPSRDSMPLRNAYAANVGPTCEDRMDYMSGSGTLEVLYNDEMGVIGQLTYTGRVSASRQVNVSGLVVARPCTAVVDPERTMICD